MNNENETKDAMSTSVYDRVFTMVEKSAPKLKGPLSGEPC